MAQNVTLWGASYSDVPALEVPKTGSGTASFFDVSDTTATASDVASGKYFYTSAGVRTEGTSSGGGVTVNSLSVTQNGTYTAPTGTAYSPVTVNVSGSSEVPENDVMFYDYDGTVLYSYSASDFANLSAMPANPSHTGLTAQGWNWSLADAKSQVSTYGFLDIGQMYTTSDGKTRIYITIPESTTSDYRIFGLRFMQ